MPHINIRYGTTKDAALIAELIENMVSEMAQFGGHAVNHSPEVWSLMAERVGANSARHEHIYLIASDGSPGYEQLGFQPHEISMVKKLSNDQIAGE